MMSQRRTAQVGLLAAVAVLVTSVGMLVSNTGDASRAPAVKAAGANPNQTQTQPPMTLSASVASGTAVAVQH